MPFPCIQTVGAKFRLYAGKTIHDFTHGASAVLSCVGLSRPLFTDCTKFVWLQASASIMCTFYAVWTCPASRMPPHWLALHLCKAMRGKCLHGRSCSLPRLSQTATLTRAQRHCGPAAAGETKNPRPAGLAGAATAPQTAHATHRTATHRTTAYRTGTQTTMTRLPDKGLGASTRANTVSRALAAACMQVEPRNKRMYWCWTQLDCSRHWSP